MVPSGFMNFHHFEGKTLNPHVFGAVLQENVQEEDHQAHQGEVWHLVFGGLRTFQNWIRGKLMGFLWFSYVFFLHFFVKTMVSCRFVDFEFH
jgi:hypothetical protein